MTFETKINDMIKAAWKEGFVDGLISLVRENLISIEIAAEESGLSVEELMQKMNAESACAETAQLEQE